MSANLSSSDSDNVLVSALTEIFTSPLHLALLAVIMILVYKIFKQTQPTSVSTVEPEPVLPKLKKRDFVNSEIRPYDGTGLDGRILLAVNGKVFDVTKGKRYYGPGGPYAGLAGRDASRGLCTFDVSQCREEYDDLSDLNTYEMDSVREWDMQFTERYDYVGKLLKPGQEPTNYSDEEEEDTSAQDSTSEKKDK